MNLSSTLFCLCFNSVEVVTSPMSVNASVGDVKVFSCVGFGEYFFWRANGKSVDGKKGFSDNGTEFNNDMIIHTTILTVNTSFVTNGTIITCISGGFRGGSGGSIEPPFLGNSKFSFISAIYTTPKSLYII